MKIKINRLPCPLHPEQQVAYKNNPNRCPECFRIARRARTAAGLDKINNVTKHKALQWSAANRGIECTLTFYQYSSIIDRPCIYAHKEQEGITIGVDRKDNAKGYTMENSVPCCQRHNRMKDDIFTVEQAIEIARMYQIDCGNKGKKGSGRRVDRK